MAGSLDVGVGMLIAASLSFAYGLEAHPPYVLVFGALFALLPDFDIVLPILKGNIEGNHRLTLFHAPLLTLGIVAFFGAIGSFYAGNIFWLVCPLVCVLWHYIHDTEGWFLGNGAIAWAWPYRKTTYTFKGPTILEEGSHDEWLTTNWLKPASLSIKELGLGALFVGAAIAFFYGSFWGCAAGVAAVLAVLIVWVCYARYIKMRT